MTAPPPSSSSTDEGVAALQIERLEGGLAEHDLYGALRGLKDLRFFTERHVVCVWDFMSLLKSMQATLTCTTWPWTPPLDSEAARLVNEIVLGEESDEVAPGVHRSHFEWYLEAMDEIGADRRPIDRLVRSLRGGVEWSWALETSGLPEEARRFAATTLHLAGGPIHVRAAAFFYGRETLIPKMFVTLVRGLREAGHPCGALNAYLDRHIEVDGGEHGPMAARLLERLIGDDPVRAEEARQAAMTALDARAQLWKAIETGLRRGEEEDKVWRPATGPSFWRLGRR